MPMTQYSSADATDDDSCYIFAAFRERVSGESYEHDLVNITTRYENHAIRVFGKGDPSEDMRRFTLLGSGDQVLSVSDANCLRMKHFASGHGFITHWMYVTSRVVGSWHAFASRILVMEYPGWQRAREEPFHYEIRCPWKSALYQVVYNYWEELEQVWSDEFESSYGVFRDEVREAFARYLNCGILRHGAARARSPSLGSPPIPVTVLSP